MLNQNQTYCMNPQTLLCGLLCVNLVLSLAGFLIWQTGDKLNFAIKYGLLALALWSGWQIYCNAVSDYCCAPTWYAVSHLLFIGALCAVLSAKRMLVARLLCAVVIVASSAMLMLPS